MNFVNNLIQDLKCKSYFHFYPRDTAQLKNTKNKIRWAQHENKNMILQMHAHQKYSNTKFPPKKRKEDSSVCWKKKPKLCFSLHPTRVYTHTAWMERLNGKQKKSLLKMNIVESFHGSDYNIVTCVCQSQRRPAPKKKKKHYFFKFFSPLPVKRMQWAESGAQW